MPDLQGICFDTRARGRPRILGRHPTRRRLLLLLLALGGLPLLATAQPATAVVGRWQPASEPGTLEIYEQQGRIFGRVVGPTAPRRLDANNSDPALRGRELLGAVILQGFRYKGRDT